MISCHALKARRDAREILHGLDVTFQAGTLTAVVGPNGAGKSTLLRALSGIASDISGEINISGTPIGNIGANRLARTVAYLPQDHHVSWPVAVRNVVALGRMPYVSSLSTLRAKDADRVDDAMQAMAVGHLGERPVTSLSGGELARVLVARLLAQDTEILLADEPAAGLDPAHGLALFEHFKRLSGRGCLVVVAMHDLSFAYRFCDQVLLLKEGRVVAFGATRDVLTRAQVAAAYGVDAAIGEVEGVPAVVPIKALTS